MGKFKFSKKLIAIMTVPFLFAIGGCDLKQELEQETKMEVKEDNIEQDSSIQLKQESNYVVYAAEYPQMNPYPKTDGFSYDEEEYTAWKESLEYLQADSEEYKEGIWEFTKETMQEILVETEGKNKIYSPLNIYMALGMLAEITDGNSREQVLSLLHTDTIETLRRKVNTLWKEHYCDDGRKTSLLASSVWLNNEIEYIPETLQQLRDTYYASSFQGEMGSLEYNTMLQEWLNEQTGGLLKEQVQEVEFSKDTIMALATTIYFQAKWRNEFSKETTSEDVFYGNNGDITCEFMHQSRSDNYYWGDSFSAIRRSFEAGGGMYLILPDEGISAEELVQDNSVMEFLQNSWEWENSKHMIVNQSIPKFDVVSNMDLIESLQKLGVRDVFDRSISDFSTLTPLEKELGGISVSKIDHAARVKIDEEGCEAAAYTVMQMTTAAMPPKEEVDFVLNRPFLFVITGDDGLPLFIGVVNEP